MVEVVEGLDLALLERDVLDLGAGLLHGLGRLVELHLLHAVGEEERDLLAIKLACHGLSPFSLSPYRYRVRGSTNARNGAHFQSAESTSPAARSPDWTAPSM